MKTITTDVSHLRATVFVTILKFTYFYNDNGIYLQLCMHIHKVNSEIKLNIFKTESQRERETVQNKRTKDIEMN